MQRHQLLLPCAEFLLMGGGRGHSFRGYCPHVTVPCAVSPLATSTHGLTLLQSLLSGPRVLARGVQFQARAGEGWPVAEDLSATSPMCACVCMFVLACREGDACLYS